MTFYYHLLKIKEEFICCHNFQMTAQKKKKSCFQFLFHYAKSFQRICADLLHCLYKVSPCEFWIAVPILLSFTNLHKYFPWKYFIQLLFSFCNSDCFLFAKDYEWWWLCRWLRHSLFFQELRRPWGKQIGTHRSLHFHDISIWIKTWSWHTLHTARLNGKISNYDWWWGCEVAGRPWEQPCSPVVSRVTLLSKGDQSSHISHSHGADKDVCCIPRGSIQDSEAPVWEKPGRGAQTVLGRKSETSHYQNQGSYWELNTADGPSRELPCALFFTAVASLTRIERHVELPPEEVNEGIIWLKPWLSSLLEKENNNNNNNI